MQNDSKHKNDKRMPGGERNPFITPQAYFDELPKAIAEKVREREDAPVRRIRPVHKAMLAAASIVIFLLLGLLLFSKKPTQNPDIYTMLSDQEIMKAENNLVSYLSEEDLMRLLVVQSDSPEDLDLTNGQAKLLPNDPQIINEEIIDYILSDELNQNIYF